MRLKSFDGCFMLWIGITGGIATGKTTAAQLLRTLGFPVVDADEIAKLVVSPGSPGIKQLVGVFGEKYLAPDGSLDRKKMASLVFENPSELRKLEGILHPLVRLETERQKKQIEASGAKLAFYDVPLLFEKNMDKDFDDIIVIASSLDRQKERLKSRSNMSADEIAARLKNQLPLEEKKKRASFVVINDGRVEDLRKQLEELVQSLLQKA
jgi:dephospho-CoA kinase